VEEKLFMKRGKKWLNITGREKRRMKQENHCLWSRAEVCGLTNLASRFALSLRVEVGCGLANEGEEQQSQTTSEQLRQTSSRILPKDHFEFQTTLSLLLTQSLFRSEQHVFPRVQPGVQTNLAATGSPFRIRAELRRSLQAPEPSVRGAR
jgi:hypothetical protein